MMEYRVVEISRYAETTERTLNMLAAEGWRLVGINPGQHSAGWGTTHAQFILERPREGATHG